MSPSPKRRRIPSGQRARSIPHKRPFIGAIAISVVFYLSVIGLLAALFVFFSYQNGFSAVILLTFVAGSFFLWLLSFFKRRNARCPLCRGTPFLDSAAHRHAHATRFFPLNYGTSAILRSIFTQKYTCQYCGTPFDLIKVPGRQARARH